MYYKTPTNTLYFLDSADFVHMIPADCVAITDEEAKQIQEAYQQEWQTKYVPQQISPRQIRMALTQISLRSQVEAAVAAGSQDLKDWYQFSTFFDRNHPQVIAMAAALNVDDQELDTLWALGATL